MGSIIETTPAAAKWPRPGRLIGLIAASLLLTPVPAHSQPAGPDLERALEAGSKRDSELRGFYERRGWQPLWINGAVLIREAQTLVSLVESADADGLSRSALRISDLAATLQRAEREASPKSLAKAEVALSRTLAAFVQGTRTPRNAGMRYQHSLLQPVVPSVAAALDAAAEAPSLQRYLETLGWMHPFYGELRALLVEGSFTPEQRRRVVQPAELLEEVQGAEEVDPEVVLRVGDAGRHRDLRREVEDLVDAGQRVAHCVRVADVPLDDAQPVPVRLAQPAQVAAYAAPGQVVEDHDLVPLVEQLGGHVGADEPGTARDQRPGGHSVSPRFASSADAASTESTATADAPFWPTSPSRCSTRRP